MSSQKDIFFYITRAFRARPKLLVTLTIAAWIFIVFAFRSVPNTYKAQVKIFAAPPTGTVSFEAGGAAKGMFSSMASMEQENFIINQESLLKSHPIYLVVSQQMKEGGAIDQKAPPSQFASIKSKINELILGKAFVNQQSSLQNTDYTSFLSKIVFNAQLDARTFTIQYDDKDPETAVKAAGLLAAALIELNVKISSEYALKMAEFLTRKFEEAKVGYQKASNDIAEFVSKNNMPDNQAIVSQRYMLLFEAEKEKIKAEAELSRLQAIVSEKSKTSKTLERELSRSLGSSSDLEVEAIITEIKRLEKTAVEHKVSADSSPAYSVLNNRIKELKRRLKSKVNRSKELLPTDTVRKLLTDSRSSEILQREAKLSARKMLDSANQRHLKYLKDIERFPRLQSKLSTLLFNLDKQRTGLELLSAQMLSAQIQSEVKYSKLFQIEDPMISGDVLTSNRMRLIVVSMLMASIFIILGTCVYDLFRGTIFDPAQLSNNGYPIYLGAIPYVKDAHRKKAASIFATKENARRIAQTLHRKLSDVKTPQGKVVTFTSEDQAAGKSSSALAVAHSLAGRGFKVLLLDCDYLASGRSVSKYAARMGHMTFNLKNFNDLAQSEAMIADKKNNQLFLPVVKIDIQQQSADHFVDPLKYLATVLNQQLASLRTKFEYIVIDGPPMLFTDALMLIEIADAVVVCCPEMHTSHSAWVRTIEAIDSLRQVDAKIFAIMTKARFASDAAGAFDAQKYQRYQGKLVA